MKQHAVRFSALAPFLAVAMAAPAYAQSGPSVDCAKPSNEVELAVCATPELTNDFSFLDPRTCPHLDPFESASAARSAPARPL